MEDGIVIYHDPRCSKSRQALQLLRDRGVEPRVVDYLVDPPGRATITADPVLLERPVVIRGKRAVIARPSERALELLDG